LVAEAVYARILSSLADERATAAPLLAGPEPRIGTDPAEFTADIRSALYASKIVSYAQGFMLLGQAAAEHDWKLDFGSIATIWAGGTIIRSAFLGEIRRAYTEDPALANLLLDPYFSKEVAGSDAGWRRVVSAAAGAGIPAPAYASALFFFDGYRTERLPANLIQAQRDFFGAHTYERVDKPRGEFFHTNWTGHGGDTTSGSYSA
jgi:6-phosphogluconate dehydrogenase